MGQRDYTFPNHITFENLVLSAEDRARDQPTLPPLEDLLDLIESQESVFFTEHNSGFISSTGSLDSTLPQVGQEREDWLLRS